MSTSDSSLVKGNKQCPWSVLLYDHPAKEHCFSQKRQWSHLGLKAAGSSLHIRPAYTKCGQQRELNEWFWKCYMPQTSLTNSCRSLKKLYIFIAFYLRCMNLCGGDRHFFPLKSKISLNCLSFGKCKQWPHSLEYLTASNSCIMISTYPLVSIFHMLMSNTCKSKKRNTKISAAEQRIHWSGSCLWGGKGTWFSESAALFPEFCSLSLRGWVIAGVAKEG